MPAARLRIALEPLDALGPHGAERAELRFTANPGEPERALARVASGGELSRVLLALVVVLADRRERTALVFDEIDAGIGGATASAVGARLARLARHAQVVCVTHLAQIASYGDVHLALRKRARGDETTIAAVVIDGDARNAEIARMLSGDERGVALEHAAELMTTARAKRPVRR
jgi:DNA repair protein RecN (Recombination protein N)